MFLPIGDLDLDLEEILFGITIEMKNFILYFCFVVVQIGFKTSGIKKNII